ncbi:MAG: sigma-54-dependent Fis family transcriptional regulator [Gammaproteobacteria bacterium]|nr:MAG: sigma-54-dependent Fis family transcriptional regulator [Gammaproteobacteria bacterium]
MATPLALVVDDEPDIRELLELTLGRMKIDTRNAADLSQAHALLEQEHFDICLTDMRLPDGNGIDLVRHIQQQELNIPVAVITAYGNMDSAVEALKAGAFDFISKPVDLQVLRNLVNSVLKLSDDFPKRDRRSRDILLGDSQPMRQIRSTIEKLSRSQAPVYISGESGTGKEMVARLIHNKGPRADKAFVPVNCGAIPSELMESEFFGHKKGSFTGAVNDKEGLFQVAEGGTLFLDEVAELPLHMQVKLLRAIQEKAVRPVGEQQEIPTDVRILSATHKNLGQLVEDGQFRQDLYYRLNVIQLPVPALREHREDIPLLAEHFLKKLAAQSNHNAYLLAEDAMQALSEYRFSGNVRELENILERATTLSEGNVIRANDLHLPVEVTDTAASDVQATPELEPGTVPLDTYMDNIEKDALLKALEKTRYNKTAAARLLGITFRALRYRLKKLGLE